MKIELLLTGKTEQGYLKEGIALYEERLRHYCGFVRKELPDKKSKELEGDAIIKNIKESDYVILLDEKGKAFSSVQFAQTIENMGVRAVKKIIFVVGGAYGFSDSVYKRANDILSLSPMTFSHQMVRLIFTEQLYRAFTIIRGEPYHHK